MASVLHSQTGTVTIHAEFGNCPRTPTSERSWRHWPTLHSSAHNSPITVSEGRSRFWGSFRLRGRSHSQSAEDNGSPTRPKRRKSIADLFNNIPSSKRHKERTWSIGGSSVGTTFLRSASPSKKSARGESASPKRRKSISNIFGASIRSHAINTIPQENHCFTQDVLGSSESSCDPQVTVGKDIIEEEEHAIELDAAQTYTVYRIPPMQHVRFASRNNSDDPFEEPPTGTVVTVMEIKSPIEERRMFSGSTATWTSNAPTLVTESSEDSTTQSGDGFDRPRTPDSYLQQLIESCEPSSVVSGTDRDHTSPTPSPAKYPAVEPVDFLADDYIPKLNERDSSGSGIFEFELPSHGIEPTRKGCGLKRQDHIIRKSPPSWLLEVMSQPESRKRVHFKDVSLEHSGDTGDIDSNFRRRLQERTERYKGLESEYDQSYKLDNEYIAESIKYTVAKMTKNFHMNRSSDEDHQTPLYDESFPFRQATRFNGSQVSPIGRNYRFDLDEIDAWDSISRGRQILQGLKKTVGSLNNISLIDTDESQKLSQQSSTQRIPSPVTKTGFDFMVERILEDSLELRVPLEPLTGLAEYSVATAFRDFANQKKSSISRIRVTRSSSSDESVNVDDLKKFSESLPLNTPRPVHHAPISNKQFGKYVATEELFSKQLDPEWLQDSLERDSTCRFTPSLAQPILRRESHSARRRIVSTAAVYVQFPVAAGGTARKDTFETKSKAVAALYDYKSGSLSNYVIYDPNNRVFYAQDSGTSPPDPEELRKKRLESVWLPLQPNSSFEALVGEIQGGNSGSSTQGKQLPLINDTQRQQPVSDTVFLTDDGSDWSSDFCQSEFSGSDSGVGKSKAGSSDKEPTAESTSKLVATIQSTIDAQALEPDWTASDEEYVIDVDPDVAYSYLGSQYSDSVDSALELEKDTLQYPDLEQVVLDVQELLLRDEDEIKLENTKTWPELGREFKTRHPELFPPPSAIKVDDKLRYHSSDEDSESSFDSESGTWSWNAEVSCLSTRNLAGLPQRGNKLHDEHFGTQSSRRPIADIGVSNSSDDDIPFAEHIENVDSNERAAAKTQDEASYMQRVPVKTIDNGGRDSVLGCHVGCGHLQCRAENLSMEPWESWIEAERAQARLFQPDPPSQKANIEAPSSYGRASTTPFAAGFPFTAYGEIMLQRSNSSSSANEVHKQKTSNLEVVDSASQKTFQTRTRSKIRSLMSPQTSAGNNTVEPQSGIPGNQPLKSGILEAVNVASTQSLRTVAPEDLNLRLIGKAARRSELAKSSKVSALVDIFKAHGLMPQTLKPTPPRTTGSPGIRSQSSTRRAGGSTCIVTPSGKIYKPATTVDFNTADACHTRGSVNRVPTPSSSLSDGDTERDSTFGEELARVEKHIGKTSGWK